MRDSRSFTGVNSTHNLFTVSPHGDYILFKKNSQELYYFDPNELDKNCSLKVSCPEILHANDTIFDLVHLNNGLLVLILHNPIENKVYFARAYIDLIEKHVKIEEIAAKILDIRTKSAQSRVIYDEYGPVLIMYPNTFCDVHKENRVIQLFHIGDYFEEGFEQVQKLTVALRANKLELWCDPFISRNTLYFFNQYDETMLTISLSSDKKFKCETIKTYANISDGGHLPSKHFFHRSVIAYEDYAFVYFSQLMHECGKHIVGQSCGQAWKLWLNSMTWEQLDLSLSHHTPISKVSVRRCGLDQAYIHGSCNIIGCPEQFHLYEINLNGSDPSLDISHESYLTDHEETPRKSSTTKFLKRITKLGGHKTEDKKFAKAQARHRSVSKSSLGERSSSLHSLHSSHSFQSGVSESGKSQIFNWSREMALQGATERNLLSDQLKQAKEMGYTDSDLMAALEYNNKSNTNAPFEPFTSTSDMIDILNLVQKLERTKNLSQSTSRLSTIDKLKMEDDAPRKFPKWTSSAASNSLTVPRSSSMNRSCSFNDADAQNPRSPRYSPIYVPSRSAASAHSSLQRLIDTFNNERNRLFEDFGRYLAEMKRKIEMCALREVEMNSKINDIETQNSDLRSQIKDVSKLENQLAVIQKKFEELTAEKDFRDTVIETLNAENDGYQQRIRELIRNMDNIRDEAHEETQRAEEALEKLQVKEVEIRELRLQLSCREDELRRKSSEPTQVLAEMEQEMGNLRIENAELRKGLPCAICMDKRREVLFVPCCHFISCEECSKESDHCSVCRALIRGKLEVYQ